MSRNLILRSAFSALILALFVLPSLADEGRIPIWRSPTIIGAPGKYVLTRNLVIPAGGGSAIMLAAAADHVDIDLNGFTVFGDPGGSPAVIEAVGPRTSVTIRNGEIRNPGPFGDGIFISGGGGVVRRAVIEDVKVIDADNGIHLEDVLSSSLRRNVINDSGLDGILITGFGTPIPITGVVDDNVIRDCFGMGIHIEGNHSAFGVNKNRVDMIGAIGIFMSAGNGYIVAENTVESATEGIVCDASNNSKIYNNSVTKCLASGITLGGVGGFLVLDNVSSYNGADGLAIFGRANQVDRNVLVENGGCGLHFGPGASDNTYGRNSARFNAGCVCAFIPAVEICTPPYGGGSFPPEFCNEGPANVSFCDNLLPGPPRS